MSQSTGHAATLGQDMAQFSHKSIMGVAFDTTERFAWRPRSLQTAKQLNRYTELEPVGMGVSGLVWYDSALEHLGNS